MLSELRRCSAGTKARRQTKDGQRAQDALTHIFLQSARTAGSMRLGVGGGVESIPLTHTPVGSRKPLSQEQRDAETCSLQR